MPVSITMPKLGLTMASGTIARWIVQPGEAVREGEPLLEVSTDKINYEVASPASGILSQAVGNDGDEFACGEVIGVIVIAGESDVPAPASPAAFVEAPRKTAAANGAPAAEPDPSLSAPAATNGTRLLASPAARRLARERGVTLAEVRGTGPRGRITLGDIPHPNVTQPSVTLSLSKGAPPHMPPARRAIHAKMTDVGQLAIAQVETAARVDAVVDLIARRRDFGWTAFAVYAVARLLRDHPDLRTDATTGAPFARIDIGVAADTPRGLIVPVVRAADTLPLAAIQREIVRLANLARDGALGAHDVGGACFSISNVGPQKIERVSPLPDPPQTAILGIGAATQRPAVVDGALTVAWMLTCVVAFDHRFVDGAPAARFLADLSRAFGDPGVLL